MQKEHEKIDLSSLEVCPLCGHKLKIHVSAEAAEARRKNGKKGGRPINPDSARQKKLRAKAEQK